MDEEPLLPLPDGSFRRGEEPSTERVQFDQFIQEKAHSEDRLTPVAAIHQSA